MTVPVPSPADHGAERLTDGISHIATGKWFGGFEMPRESMMSEAARLSPALVELIAEAEAATRLREALRQYGRHLPQCQTYAAGRIQVEVCTCGLTAAEYS